MPRYLLSVEVDGARFSGTQVQSQGERTVQGALAEALAPLGLDGIGPGSRLDQGVSAACLPVAVHAAQLWDPATLGLAINQRLPDDLVVVRAAAVDEGFAVRDAAHKTYRYRVISRPTRPVLDRAGWWVRDIRHPELLGELAALIPGERDLSGFAALRHDETDGLDPVRRYFAASWDRHDEGAAAVHTFRITGAGFLYKQVRGLVGAMVTVAMGRAGVDAFRAVLAAGRDARKLGNMAPAEGLLLEAVAYDPEPHWVAVSIANRAP
jgi:tRNA pseudouridine38-40 synthase